jgi:beta-barrel assembly-enhancing protease
MLSSQNINPSLGRWALCRRWLARALIPVLLTQSVAAQLPPQLPDLGDPAQAELTPVQEKRMAEEVMRIVRFHEPSYLNDPEVEEYLSALGQKLLAGGVSKDREYQFFILKDPSINAFAMPGGVIGVHTGLVVTSQAESELASVLAHEIGHVEQNHMARMVSRQGSTMTWLLAAMLLAVLAGRNSPDVASAAVATGQAAALQSQLNYSRDYEREADRVGLQILQGSGLDPQGMPNFFERMYQHTRGSDNNAPAYLRTHPLTLDRVSDISGRVRQIGARPQPESLEYALVRAKLEALQLGAQSRRRAGMG